MAVLERRASAPGVFVLKIRRSPFSNLERKEPSTTKPSAIQSFLSKVQAYRRHRRQLRILKLFGTIDFDPAYDYKKERQRDASRIAIDDAKDSDLDPET